jgi:hypothetical protein
MLDTQRCRERHPKMLDTQMCPRERKTQDTLVLDLLLMEDPNVETQKCP